MEINYKKYLADLILMNNEIPKYIMGRNTVTSQVVKFIPGVVGIIDEYTKEEFFQLIPVVHHLSELKPNAIILNCVFNAHSTSSTAKLEKLGLDVIDVFSFLKYSKIPVCIDHYSGFDEIYDKRKNEFDMVYRRMKDETSRRNFVKLLDFRYNHNVNSMNTFIYDLEKQYFEPFLELKTHGEVFVDVGGYDGLSSSFFIRNCPQFSHIYFIEPGKEYCDRARTMLKDYNNVSYYELAASFQKGVVRFNLNGDCSSESDVGGLDVPTDTIDNIVRGADRISYIKMDVEGSEKDAIAGAKETILNYHPRLAISVYHRPGDYVDLPNQILGIRDDYDLYLRHYTEGVNDSVMYFVPKGS